MRMFLYYAVHSFWNQLKKLFKSWVIAFILICFVVGAGIGILAVTISNLAEQKQAETEITEQMEQTEEDEDEQEEKPESAFQVMIRDEIGYASFIELIAGGLVILILALSIVNADKNAGKIFLPADVNLLFPSPLKPQSVMMFRIANQLGQMLILGLYLMFQLPNLVINLGLNIWAALALIVAFCILNFFSTLFQLLFYLLGNVSFTVKKMLRPVLVTGLAIVAGLFFMYQRTSGLAMPVAAARFFNAKGTQYIPFWGWLKGFCRAAVDQNLGAAMLYLGLIVVGAAVMIYVIWSLKVDFYEDAMAKSEEVAELLEAARTQNNGFMMKRKKDRSEKLKRDGLQKGCGANVFFFKNMYNRFRFAHFGIFTKTMEFYLLTAVAVGLVCRLSLQTNNVLLLVAVFAGLCFYRSLGNPLEADTKMSYFVMIPENTWAKLFYSLLAGLVNTALDMVVPMIVGALIMGANPLVAVAWIFAILSIDLYSTIVGAFINLSLPANAGLTIKQFVQVMFVYFGILPDVLVLAVGGALGHIYLGAAAAFLINLALGFLFFVLASMCLEPHGGTRPVRSTSFN
ncbi:MAG: hypothetical protein E7295_11825 [Lachnospiraceae bacterium]|nr:hypothetical protein [Lachnospiraceae bacterium]